MKKVTDFQAKVYEALKLIPEGRVTTYKLLGKFIDCKSSQAIGQALKKNPFAPDVPCHRVIKTDLSIGGFYGEVTGEKITDKLKILSKEGVIFEDGFLADEKQLIDLAKR
ncbi:MAG: MGMT family protein [Lentisphaeraceae bacterium]|nr:MGMT family protein [Lentisphaeraceae bacterium]